MDIEIVVSECAEALNDPTLNSAAKIATGIRDLASELAESELSRTELIKQNQTLAAENERLEAVINAAQEPAGKVVAHSKGDGESFIDAIIPVGTPLYRDPAPAQAPAVVGAWNYGEDNDGWYVELDGVQMIYGLRKDQANLVCDLLNATLSQIQQTKPAVAVPDAWEVAQKVRAALDRRSCPDAFMRIAFEAVEQALQEFTSAPSHDRCPSHEPHSAPVRSPQDYAIEHAEYMAVNAESLLEHLNTIADEDEGVLVPDDSFSDYVGALKCGIHDFRKRRDRCQNGVQDSGVVDHE